MPTPDEQAYGGPSGTGTARGPEPRSATNEVLQRCRGLGLRGGNATRRSPIQLPLSPRGVWTGRDEIQHVLLEERERCFPASAESQPTDGVHR